MWFCLVNAEEGSSLGDGLARRARLAGVGTALATLAFYVQGSSRAFSWDASNTVGNFVATPSLLDPFRRQVSFNNHVLFSALEHVVYTVTGSKDERVLRVVPIVLAVVAVGLLTWEVARRLGPLAGVVAGVVVAANPFAVLEFREARGYSLLVLCAVVSTSLLLRLREDRRSRPLLVVAYCAAVGIGIGTHLYMLAVVVLHAAFVVENRAALRRWLPRWAVAVAIGLAPTAIPVSKALSRHQYRNFHPLFPLQLTYDMLGGQAVAFVALLPLAVLGAWSLRRRAPLRRAAMALAAMVVTVWLIGPEFLYSRFFLWLLPAVAAAAAIVVARRPALVGLVVLAVGAQVVTRLPGLGQSQVPNRTAAALVAQARSEGLRPCAIRSTGTTLAAYATGFTVVRQPGQLDSCDLVVVAEGPFDPALVRAAAASFPYSTTLAAKQPGISFSRRPIVALPAR